MFFIPRSATAAGTLLGAALLATGCAGAPETPPQKCVHVDDNEEDHCEGLSAKACKTHSPGGTLW